MVNKEEAIVNLNRNIDFIKLSKGLSSDSDLCRASGIRKGTLSSVRNDGKVPMVYPFFKQLSEYSGYGINDMLDKDLAEEEGELQPVLDESLEQEFKKYEDPYCGYYFGTPQNKGREFKDDAEALSYAVVLIYSEGEGDYRAIADFGLTREEQAERYNFCFTVNGNKKVVRKKNYKSEYVNRYFSDDLYDGSCIITDESIVLELESTTDRITMMMNKAITNKTRFNGALAAAISVCKGTRPCPVMQVVGLSKGILPDLAGNIAQKLYLTYPSIKCQKEDETEIFQMFRHIRSAHSGSSAGDALSSLLTEEQERIILHEAMSRAINRTVKRNLARSIKVTEEDDDDWDELIRKCEEV